MRTLFGWVDEPGEDRRDARARQRRKLLRNDAEMLYRNAVANACAETARRAAMVARAGGQPKLEGRCHELAKALDADGQRGATLARRLKRAIGNGR